MSTHQRPIRIATLTLLLQAVAYYGYAWREFAPDTVSWRALPAETTNWKMTREDALGPDVLARLQPDNYVSRVFTAKTGGRRVSLFVGFFRMREGRGPHSPTACLPGAGWKLLSSSQVAVPRRGGGGLLKVNQLVAAQDSRQTVVLYWYQMGQRTFLSQIRAQVSAIPDLLLHGPTGISLVRVAAAVDDGDLPSARNAAAALAGEMYPFLLEHAR